MTQRGPTDVGGAGGGGAQMTLRILRAKVEPEGRRSLTKLEFRGSGWSMTDQGGGWSTTDQG